MKNTICFTGFSGGELELLQAKAAGVADIWDCQFIAAGEKVLLAMSSASFEVVVANVHINDMSGAELLHHVGKLQPNTLRIAVGDLVEQNLVIDYIGGPHRFVARPFQPDELVSVIRRSLALDAWLASDLLRALLPKLTHLPGLPSTYFEVLKKIESPYSTVQEVGEVIANDPAVTVRLLQMVNSVAFSLAQKITDPVDAVALLGLETVKSLVLCLQVFNENELLARAGVSMEHLWDHSLTVAKTARQIMLQLTSAPRLANDAFTAGLLHDIGRIVMAINLPKDYAEIIKASRQLQSPLHIEEIRRFGVNHTQVGAYLLGVWGMPVGLVEAAALHHAPSHTATSEISILTAVHVGNVLAHEQSPGHGIPKPAFDVDYLVKLGLPTRVEEWLTLLKAERTAEVEAGEEALAAPVLKSKQVSEPTAAVVNQVAKAEVAAAAPSARPMNFFLVLTGLMVLVGLAIWLMVHH
jgi:putative nucleotidyltransferase with HDIG domain